MTKVRSFYQGKYPRRVIKTVEALIHKVPSQYLTGLDEVVIVGRSAYRKKHEALGIYVPAAGSEQPRIELAIENIFAGVPRIVFYLPFIDRFLLARVLYHEIGHHHQFINPRRKKERIETHAEDFTREMLLKTFRFRILLLTSLIKIRKWLVNRRAGDRDSRA